jgi:hypothetical protein
VPNLIATDQLRGALALSFGLHNLTMVIGPAFGGILIGALGIGAAYVVDAASCLAMIVAAFLLSSQLPKRAERAAHEAEPACSPRSPRGCASSAPTARSPARSSSTCAR